MLALPRLRGPAVQSLIAADIAVSFHVFFRWKNTVFLWRTCDFFNGKSLIILYILRRFVIL